jgi:flavin-dependent dehydrogenase
MAKFRDKGDQHTALPDGATIVIVGGGPAGAFFAIRVLRRARELGKQVHLRVLEQKGEVHFREPMSPATAWEGCNYCAGGISPRLADVLRENDLALPAEIVEGRATQITVHGDWKSIELPIPVGRDMLSVFRGSRPERRPDRYMNLDSYLLNRAVDEGAKVITAEARDIHYAPSGKPVISYCVDTQAGGRDETIEADLVVFAVGVNRSPGMEVASNALFEALAEVLPSFHPPRVRKALIVEMEAEGELLGSMQGEVHFVPYGSKDLHIEMSSLIPKGRWMTVVLLGRSIDRAPLSQYLQVVERFLDLPHMKRALPQQARLRPVCLCHPNMTVGAASNAIGHRIAMIGDVVVSRLYKDGLYSAYLTSSALATCVLDQGIDQRSLESGYWPIVRRIDRDNRFGRLIFLVTHVVFSHPVLSRVVYQALLTERKTTPNHTRRLADVLWRISSGDDGYGHVFAAMFHPAAVWRVLVGGGLVTIRNYVTERVFGLRWSGFGRYPTGVPREDVEKKREDIMAALGVLPFDRVPDVETMYSIRIKSDEAAILRQLAKFGDKDREYFRPRMIRVRRIAGDANEVGSTIRYDVVPRWFSFSVVLEKVVAGRYLLYRALDGFPQGGILAFDVDRQEAGSNILTIYVAFDFPRRKNPLKGFAWWLFRLSFPTFVHDVLWNHALCKLKYLVESADAQAS